MSWIAWIPLCLVVATMAFGQHVVVRVAFAGACVASAAASYGSLRARCDRPVLQPGCRLPHAARIDGDPAYYFHCLLHGSWWKWPPLWWYGFRRLWPGWGVLIAGGLTLAAIGTVIRLGIAPGSADETEPVASEP